jgi:three-Cys-motif partner protein
MRTNLLVTTDADGAKTTPIRKWALDKYKLVSLYSRLFSTSMKLKWPIRTYIDLCAGSGFSEVEETRQLYWGTPLLALGVPDPFDSYIFCERDPDSLLALRKRVNRLFPNADAHFIEGDCNERMTEILGHMPSGNGVLSFCFGDPFDLSIKFSSIEVLVQRRVDFLFTLALHMDANRNAAHYANPDNRKIDEFLGLLNWRTAWQDAEAKGVEFPKFLGERFSCQMESVGYLPVPIHKMKQIRSDVNNRRLYHLALFSKHPLAFNFLDQALKYSTDQTSFDY